MSLCAATARAQTTADGISALVRNDVGTAAAILQPIVEHLRTADPAAAFFLGTLYETGRGVPLDPLRACALYQMAAVDETSTFAASAMRLLKHSILSHRNPKWQGDCSTLANIGLASRFEPKSFTFGDQTVEWSIGGAAVTWHDRERWFPSGVMTPGIIFLPLRDTPLRSPAVSATPLYFVQLAYLLPLQGKWDLRWTLYLVRDGEARMAAQESLATFDGPDPPDLSRFYLESAVELRVNDHGQPEYKLASSPSPRALTVK